MFDMTYRAHVPPRAILVNGPLARISVTIEMADAGDLEVSMPPIMIEMAKEAPGIARSSSICSGVLVAEDPTNALNLMNRAPVLNKTA